MNTNEKLSRFLALSSALTGFDFLDLEGTGMAPGYIDIVDSYAGDANIEALLATFDDLASEAPRSAQTIAIRRGIMSDQRLGPLARNIIKLWYFGIWYQMPSPWRLAFAGGRADRTFVVSDVAYKNALVWRAMLAHAKGARQPGFGSWQFPPGQP